MIKYVIFDLDGTLLDTMEDIAGACNHALHACSCPMHETEKYRTFVGRGIMNLFRSALPEGQRTEDMVMRMKDNFVPYYDEHKNDLTRPYPGILELLDGLTAKGIRLAVASNKYQEATEELVARYFGDYRFVCVLGQRDGHPIKPDAGIIIEAMDIGFVPLEIQKNVIEYIGAEKLLNIKLGESFIMTPMKSVTAIMGIKK